jgi:hypothetical protein
VSHSIRTVFIYNIMYLQTIGDIQRRTVRQVINAWKESGRTRSWRSRGTITPFAWRDRRKSGQNVSQYNRYLNSDIRDANRSPVMYIMTSKSQPAYRQVVRPLVNRNREDFIRWYYLDTNISVRIYCEPAEIRTAQFPNTSHQPPRLDFDLHSQQLQAR